jgi:predicted dehydrogenase
MQILICGLGSIGRRHLRNLVALGQDDIVLYRTGKSTLPDDELADWPSADSLDEALERWSPQAAVIANPTSLHLDTSLAAAEAGCSLLIEKPIAERMDGLDHLSNVLEARGGRALVGFQFRFHPGLRAASELLASGAIGEPISARVVWGEYLPGWHPWEDYRRGYSARADLGGGVLLTLCHPFDYLRWFFGDVASVTAECRRSAVLDLDVEDTADVLLEFGSGVTASVHLDYHQQPTEHHLTIVGSRGTLRWDNASGGTRFWNGDDSDWRSIPAPDPMCRLEDGIGALQVALAARQSSDAGQRIPID